jgi:hypothetical protein
MISRIKNWITLISIVIAILASIFGMYSMHLANKREIERDNSRDELAVKTTEVTTYINANGQLVTKTIEYEKTVEELKNSTDSIEKLLYAAYKASDLKKKQIDRLLSIQSHSSGGGVYTRIDTIRVSDSIEYIPIIKHFNDGFLDLVVYEDSINYNYTENFIILSATRLEERDFFLWKWIGWKKKIDKNLIQVSSSNPNSTFKTRTIKIE